MTRLVFILLFINTCLNAQELFPHNEPASSTPKNALGIRVFGESYDEFGRQRNLTALRIIYGATSKLSLELTSTVSNHHARLLPANLINHSHDASGKSIDTTGNFQRGLKYPYLLNGIYILGKYRFLSIDGKNKHFRMAIYGEYSYIEAAHDETEPNLLDDTKGYGGGLISTYLKNHFATSFNAGFIIPGDYKETTPDPSPSGGELHTRLQYGRALIYNLSFGYLVYPAKYKNYSQTNINVYLEFMGKSYEKAKIIRNNKNIEPKTDLLLAGNYVEVHPGIQAIIDSNLRIDFSVGLKLINKSYARFYPVYMLGIQRYFFL